MTKFAHFRHIHRAEEFDAPVEVATKGGKTVAYTEENGIVRFAVATCSSRDNFCRKTGRYIAEQRLKSHKLVTTVQLVEGQSAYEAISEAL